MLVASIVATRYLDNSGCSVLCHQVVYMVVSRRLSMSHTMLKSMSIMEINMVLYMYNVSKSYLLLLKK